MKHYEMKYWPRPNMLEIFCGFHGLTSYYRKFDQNYGKHVSFLTTLLKKNTFIGMRKLKRIFKI
jgi:hypothetical protein